MTNTNPNNNNNKHLNQPITNPSLPSQSKNPITISSNRTLDSNRNSIANSNSRSLSLALWYFSLFLSLFLSFSPYLSCLFLPLSVFFSLSVEFPQFEFRTTCGAAAGWGGGGVSEGVSVRCIVYGCSM
ncbi:hypothetical protein L211DRAFT_569531 [Terfezia boudieri ATCC MYA-4762]|uniref:Transmembrane protein n=1 Tax=Terfezia boudieri ATCC MYA-4762 TaxID=1051890 RepID=A0A3N4LXV8_9PEZI|nr:hypothetical protein L211DRAFT_569531 [Terfezia boudieri ATCC MYA-4762]